MLEIHCGVGERAGEQESQLDYVLIQVRTMVTKARGIAEQTVRSEQTLDTLGRQSKKSY